MSTLARRRAVVVVVGLAALLVSACSGVPTSGPVVEVSAGADLAGDQPVEIAAARPQPNESPSEIVLHFLDAMMASPIRTSVAREFLTQEAANRWDPQQGTIIYGGQEIAPTDGASVAVTLTGGARLDSRGGWRGNLSSAESVLRFPLARENGEWRISRAPDALIVRDSWFAQRFRQVSLYFLDSSSTVLVPEPVYVPSGDQLSTALVTSLLRGPGPGLVGVERTAVPAGASSGLVPVSSAGVARIDLGGVDVSQLSADSAQLMLVQLAWTMRQDPRIRSLQVSVGGEPLTVRTGDTSVDVSTGADYAPTGIFASGTPFGLRDGVLVSGPLDAMQPVEGTVGTERQSWRSLAVDLQSLRVAGVTTDGSAVAWSRLRELDAPVRQVVSGAADLLRPAWDVQGTLWLVDRRADGAVVLTVDGPRRADLTVPGVTGERVHRFLVSRDGSRLVAVLRRSAGDVLVVSRLRRDEQGRVVSATPGRVVPWTTGVGRIQDIGWRSPISISVLSQPTEDKAEVRTVSVDGSPGFALPSATRATGRMRWLVSSPVAAEHSYAVARNGLISDLTGPTPVDRPAGVDLSTLTYAG